MPITRAARQRVEHGLAVAAEAEGGVDEHGALALERGRQQGDDPVQEDRDVEGDCSSTQASRSVPEAGEEQEGQGDTDRGDGGEDHQRDAPRGPGGAPGGDGRSAAASGGPTGLGLRAHRFSTLDDSVLRCADG